MPPVAPVAPPQASVTYLIPANLRSLMASLVKSEVLSMPAASTPTAQVTSTSASSKQEGASAVKDVNTREYGKLSLSETTTFVEHSPFTYLNSPFNFKQRRRIVELLYEQQTSSNSKVDQGRCHSQSSFTSLEDWLDDASGSEKGKRHAHSSSLAPTKIYPSTCHAVAARLRPEKQKSNRSAKPEVYPMHAVQSSTLRLTSSTSHLRKSESKSPPQLIPSDSKVAGVKRKVDHDDSNLLEDGIDTPPFKKLAPSSAPIPSS
ncbi:hypothetical protein CPB83DRAFT_841244 [Crepidotus variabilis]|uniref:Uncharacterized protein n=1 Tax=Crepidotus variabilis TaxID=179855 RepID=A0A9P6E2J9_9AGAR|nr:hypothetical protein CPB83DRAFT_841244 [Crepidotus variabilis]